MSEEPPSIPGDKGPVGTPRPVAAAGSAVAMAYGMISGVRDLRGCLASILNSAGKIPEYSSSFVLEPIRTGISHLGMDVGYPLIVAFLVAVFARGMLEAAIYIALNEPGYAIEDMEKVRKHWELRKERLAYWKMTANSVWKVPTAGMWKGVKLLGSVGPRLRYGFTAGFKDKTMKPIERLVVILLLPPIVVAFVIIVIVGVVVTVVPMLVVLTAVLYLLAAFVTLLELVLSPFELLRNVTLSNFSKDAVERRCGQLCLKYLFYSFVGGICTVLVIDQFGAPHG